MKQLKEHYMNDKLLDLVIENSIREKLVELIDITKDNIDESGTGVTDISPTDRIIGSLIKEVFPGSLAGQICSIQPLTGPEGHIIAIGRKRDVNNNVIKGDGSGIETRRTFVHAEDHKIETDFTLEFIQDLINQFGESGYDFLTAWLKNTLIEDMNDALIADIRACAVDAGHLVPKTDSDFDGGTHSIIYKAQKLYGEILSKTNRFFNPFVICTPSIGMMLTLGSDSVEKTEHKNYLGTVANFQIYIDNNATDDYVIVGHQGKDPGDAGYIFSPYVTQVYESTSAHDGTMKIFVNNRYSLTKNPADRDTTGTNSDFFAKFTVDLSVY
jgi:hypothetical protein